jgi:hypothetical protein
MTLEYTSAICVPIIILIVSYSPDLCFPNFLFPLKFSTVDCLSLSHFLHGFAVQYIVPYVFSYQSVLYFIQSNCLISVNTDEDTSATNWKPCSQWSYFRFKNGNLCMISEKEYNEFELFNQNVINNTIWNSHCQIYPFVRPAFAHAPNKKYSERNIRVIKYNILLCTEDHNQLILCPLLWMIVPKSLQTITVQGIHLLLWALVPWNEVEMTFRSYIIYAYLRDVLVANTTRKK